MDVKPHAAKGLESTVLDNAQSRKKVLSALRAGAYKVLFARREGSGASNSSVPNSEPEWSDHFQFDPHFNS